MNALSRLLTKVSKRVLTNNPTNDDLLQTADRVVLWSNAGYISEQQVEDIASALPEPVETADVEADEPSVEETENEA